jgi:hypothetical protein
MVCASLKSVAAIGIATSVLSLVCGASSAEAARAKRSSLRPQMVAAITPPVTALTSPSLRAVAPVAAPLVAAISLNAQSVTVFSGTDVIARSAISSGMAGHRTPTGVFSIIQKARYHESNIYDNAPMPFMQRLTWSGVALHAGNLPGYPASHGCVRLPYGFAERLFGMLKTGTRVVVAPEVVTPEPIVHAALPKPIYTPVTMVASAPALGRNIVLASTGTPSNDVTFERLLNPVEAAELEKRRAQTALIEAQADARRMLDIAADAALSAEEATRARLGVEREIVSFRGQLQRALTVLAAASDDETRVQAEATVAAVEEAIADATAALPELRRTEQTLFEASFVDARNARDAEDAAERADNALRVANRGAEPITVFISRADQRVQVRQGFHTILDGDVTIQDAQLPLGTHVMTAGGLLDPNAGLRWTSVSMSDGPTPRVSASNAMNRITIDPKLADEIGRRVWTGATVLISDQPASRETGRGTDFVILTK